MQGNLNPKILGASAIGIALVLGAFMASGFGTPRTQPQTASVNTAPTPPARVAIAVEDTDQNGIEDWRDDFVTTEPIVVAPRENEAYTPPDTLTGQMGISFFEGYVRSKGFGPFARTQDEVIDDTVSQLETTTAHELFDTPDITILRDWDDEDIVNYGNTIASIVDRNSVEGLEGELFILYDIVRNENTDRMNELITLSQVYEQYRDQTLEVPVPAFLAKEHLDLINSYHAIQRDIDAMTKALDDPAYSLMRIKRYEDDATGLTLSFQNMYKALEPHASLFNANDPAVLFVAFSPQVQL